MGNYSGVPPSDYETAEGFSQPGGGYEAPPSGGGKSRNMTIVIVVVVVLLCCCCLGSVGGYYLWNNGDALMQQFGSIPVLSIFI